MLEFVVAGRKANELVMSATPTTGKQIAATSFTMPVFEDLGDEPTVLIRTSTNTDSSMNFVTVLRGMQ